MINKNKLIIEKELSTMEPIDIQKVMVVGHLLITDITDKNNPKELLNIRCNKSEERKPWMTQ